MQTALEDVNPLLAVENLTVFVQATGLVLVDRVSFALARGECLGLVGDSGSGKTLLCRALTGLLPAGLGVRGRVRFAGRDLLGVSEREWRTLRGRGVSVIVQQAMTAFDPLLPLGTQLEGIFRDRLGLEKEAARALAARECAAVGLPDSVARSYPHELSGGMLQRCMIAVSLGLRSGLVVADEPTTALDAALQHEILQQLCALRGGRAAGEGHAVPNGTGLIFVSHDLGAVQLLADTVLVLQQGRCVEQGPAAQLLGAPVHPCTQHLVRTRLALSAACVRGKQILAGQSAADLATCGEGSVGGEPAGEEPAKLYAEDRAFVRVQHVDKSYADPGQSRDVAGNGTGHLLQRLWRGLWTDPQKTVLQDVSLTLAKGAITGLLGGSGSGKSTLARLILGLERPDRGDILVDNLPLARWRKANPGRMAAVFQDHRTSINPRHTVEDCLAEGFWAAGRTADSRAIAELMDRVELPSSLRHRRCLELSGGQGQRVCLARALAARPALLVLDEALSALDVSVQTEMVRLLRSLAGETTCLFITHDLQLAWLLCQDIVVVHQGRVTDVLPAGALAERLRTGSREGVSGHLAGLLDHALVFRSDFV